MRVTIPVLAKKYLTEEKIYSIKNQQVITNFTL